MDSGNMPERGLAKPLDYEQRTKLARFSPFRLSIKQRLPLLIGVLLLIVIAASTIASYRNVKNAALDVSNERLRLLTQQLVGFIQQSSANTVGRMHTTAVDPAIRGYFLSPKSETKTGAVAALQKVITTQPEQNALNFELWDANHSLLLVLPEGSSKMESGLETEFNQSATLPSGVAFGSMRVVKDVIVYPVVASVKNEAGQTTGYLVRWRKVAATPESQRAFSDLLGNKAQLYFGNIQGDVWTNLVTIVPRPPVDISQSSQITHYSKDGKSSVAALGRPVAGTPWAVMVEFSDDEIMTPVRGFLRRMLIVGFVLLIIGLISAWILSRSITQPLQTLTEASTAMAHGDYARFVDIRSDDELGKLANAFNTMVVQVRDSQKELEQKVKQRTAQLETVNKELEAFSYSVSHDLRAPLRAINGFSRILLDNYSQMPDDAKRYLNLVCTNAQQMGRLIDDLLAFSRLGRQQIKKQEVSPEAIVHQVMDELKVEKQGRQVDVSIGDLPSVQADASLLKQVYTNLLSNALKYTNGNEVARIEVSSMTDGELKDGQNGATVYYVKDNGTGFDMQYAHKLFGVFQRLHRTEDYEGTGVGLAIVQNIINRHGGRVWAEAEVGKGATFFFTLQGDN